MTLELGFDATPLVQTQAGTARYIAGLLRELRARADIVLRDRSFGGEGRAWNPPRDAIWYPFVLAHELRDVDVLHCPTYRGPVTARPPLVVTVHDLAIFRHPQAFNLWSRLYAPLLVPHVLRAARRVIAVSEFTKRELAELLDVPPEKVRVIPNAVEPTFAPGGSSAAGEYVLAVGTLEPRKNLGRLAEAAQRLGVELRVVGARGWGNVEVGGAMEELADGAAELVDPLDPAAIATGIERADARRDELVPRGLERARAFSWADVAAKTVDAYEEAVA